MKVLVTGAGGFLGENICRLLLKEELGEVHGVGRNFYKKLPPEVIQHQVDLCDFESLKKMLKQERFDGIIHSAAKAGVWGSLKEYYNINFRGTLNLLELAKKWGVKHFVYTSTPSVVFGRDSIRKGTENLPYPAKFLTHYAYTKSMAEKEVLGSHQLNFQTAALRPHLIYGPGDPHILPRLLEKHRKGKLRIVGSGSNLVDVTHVENAAFAHIQCLKKMMETPSFGGEAYFIGDPKPVNLWRFINRMLVANGEAPLKKRVSGKLSYVLGYFCEVFYRLLGLKKDPPMTRFVALQLSKDHYFSHDKARKDFGYLSRDISDSFFNGLRF